MIKFLDFRIFGGGRGMAVPLYPGRFYWLIDTYTDKGTFYTFSPGYGSQLTSYQWTHPRVQERRKFHNHEFRPFWSTRRWGRVSVSWSRVTPFKDPEEFGKFEQILGRTT